MSGHRSARRYVLGHLLVMLAAYFALAWLSEQPSLVRSDLDVIALILSYVAIVVISATMLRAIYVVRGLAERRPFRPDMSRDRSIWEIRGIVVADAETFEGPDGRPCVAALRVDRTLAPQNRWISFSLDVDGERILLESKDPLLAMYGRPQTWTHTAMRPRSFGHGAWAPDLVDDTRLDWVCVRPGDYVRIHGSDLRWVVAPPRTATSASHQPAATGSPPRSVPYRTADALVAELHRNEEGFGFTVEVIHPRYDLAWRRRAVIRTATLVCRFCAGIAVFSWVSFAFEQLGFLAPMPWLLVVLAIVLLVPVYGAHIASTQRLARWDPTPPPWDRTAEG